VSDEAGIGAVMRQYGGFLLAGTLAFLTDAVVLAGLIRLAGFDPLIARLFAITTAMVVSWLLNRTITFRVGAAPSAREFMRFAALAWITAALNYAVFAAVLLALPGTYPLVALVISSLSAAIVAYICMRFAVFTS
jgi:putative flippase GtrA